MRFSPKIQPFFLVKSIISNLLQAALLLFSFAQVATAQSSPPVIVREPYRILYNASHDPVGEWPPLDHPHSRIDASSLVNIGCAIDLRIDASGTELSYQWKKGTANIPGANSSQLYIPVTALTDAGLYRCEVTNPYGSVLSRQVRMGVVNIEASDHFVAAAPTASVSFSTSQKFPTTSGGFKFRWYRMVGSTPSPLVDDVMLTDGGGYTGTAKSLLRIKVTDTTPAGRYYCMITAYNTYMLTGLRNLAVVPAPNPTMVQLDAPMEFSVSPVGPSHLLSGLTYQWLKDGAEIPDEEADTYVVANAGAGDAGQYSVAVTHPTLGTVTTPQVAGVVIDPPVSHAVAVTGKTAALSAPPALSTAQTFQWFRNGNPLSDGGRISGATKVKLSIKTVQVADAGEYECRGTLYGDTVVIARPVLIVIPAPLSKVVAVGSPLELQAQPAYGGSDDVNPALFSYQWVKGKGTSAVVLTEETGQSLNIANAAPEDFGQYSCQIGYNGSTPLASPLASVAVVDTTPLTFNVNAGKNVRLTPVVYAPRGAGFQWSFEGSPLENGTDYTGATTNRLTVLAASVSDAGDYQCQISYPGGSSVIAPVEVVVFSAPEILDLEFPPAIVGGDFDFQIEVSDDPLYVAQSYDARPLPKGLVINKLTGQISGVPTVAGEFDVLVSVKNAVGTTTQVVPLNVSALPERFGGRFIAPLPRMPAGEFGEFGGRLDMAVTSAATLSGKILVGATSHSFKGVLSVSGTDPMTATATAEVLVSRTEGNLTLTFSLLTDNYLHNGQITGAGNTVNFAGWRATYSMTEPPTELAGIYNFGLLPPAPPPPDVPPLAAPQGFGYATLNLSDSPGSDIAAGAYNMVVRLADDMGFTCAGFAGPDGELLVYRYLYGTSGGGSVVSTGLSLGIDADAPGKPVTGDLSWTRPATTTRRYKEGFGPAPLTAAGGLYAPTDRLLSANQGTLTFEAGGLDLASRNPDATFDISLGDVLPVRTAANDALTVIKNVKLAAGSFSGSFSLADDNPTTATVNPVEYKRTVNFKGLVVPMEGQWVGVGFFIMPQIPTLDPLTTTSTSPELSGNLLFEPVVD